MENKELMIIKKVLEELGFEHSLINEGNSIYMVVPNPLSTPHNDSGDSEAEISVENGKCVIYAVNKDLVFNPDNYEDCAVEGEALEMINNKGFLLKYEEAFFKATAEERAFYCLEARGSMEMGEVEESDKLREYLRKVYGEIENMEVNMLTCFTEAGKALGYW